MPNLRPSEKPATSNPHSEFTGTETTHSTGRDVQPRSTAQYGHSLPPLASLASLTSSNAMQSSSGMNSPTGGRGFGMHDILNPQSSSGSNAFQDLRHSPHRVASGSFAPHPPPMRSPRGRKRVEPTSPAQLLHMPTETRQPRRMLTPKSPAVRALSTGSRLSPASAGASTMPSSIPEGRMYTADPGDYRGQVPPLPVMPPNVASSIPAVGPPRHGAATPRTSMDSSSASYSTGAQIGLDSPRMTSERAGLSPPNSGAYESGAYASSRMAGQAHDMTSRAHQRAVTTGMTAYQMQLNTEAGPITVDVDIDTQQASKLADEKRKRNAGASARFRQRRKEKEQAASQAISDLQRQLRELTEDREFYMHERNFFRDIYGRTPGAQAQPRPPSPRVRRMQGPGANLVPDVSPRQEYARSEVSDGGPSQRRRTGDYRPSFSSTPVVGPATYPNYAPAPYALPPPPPPPPAGAIPPAGSMIDTRTSAPAAPQGARAPPFDPFRRDIHRQG